MLFLKLSNIANLRLESVKTEIAIVMSDMGLAPTSDLAELTVSINLLSYLICRYGWLSRVS